MVTGDVPCQKDAEKENKNPYDFFLQYDSSSLICLRDLYVYT